MTIVKPKRNNDGSLQCDIKHTRGDSGYITILSSDGRVIMNQCYKHLQEQEPELETLEE